MKTYKIGTRVSVGKREAILALVDNTWATLIDLHDGNRYSTPMLIDDHDAISLKDIRKMACPYAVKITLERQPE